MEDKVIRLTYTNQATEDILISSECFKNEKQLLKNQIKFITDITTRYNTNYININEYFPQPAEIEVYLSTLNIRKIEILSQTKWYELYAKKPAKQKKEKVEG